MKTTQILSLLIFALIICSCSSTKETTTEGLFDTEWELEYISGPRIAFSGLYPDKKPKIKFNEATNKVEGNNSCNGYSADFTLNGAEISFGEPGPTTMMYCGEGESTFLNTMEKVNRYTVDDEGKLNLMIDDVPMMRFKKSTQE
ncbi:heat shock protein HslJ [Algoriphagus sp. 4150]|uniref:META domain-containing protein n=1 Tax=Algoriphagus sp. 4150 TaxID=2817756 RepID=UPI00286783CA|nr:META domain-containing protein [Algoriphagus sp. 4150]MDR7131439.1 heat shock protein HslJ [Algoriphagus sp. 4150]